ncbi:hypothetical protein BH23BAC3_BH23BAC3_27860 [soil metagenome]
MTLLLGNISKLFAQESDSEKTSANNDAKSSYTLKALKLDTESQIQLDGKLDETIWQQADVAIGFTQRSPHDGSPATQKTEARVAYSGNAIYIGATMYDTAMDSVAATLFRKDGNASSDWFLVAIDSYNDNRTAFAFGVNPKGVRQDVLLYNDTNGDQKWDAVWEAKTHMGEEAWTVEMRIPLSQLRFDGGNEVQSWDINFRRDLARNDENSYWSPTPQNKSGIVSKFGSLMGVEGLEEPKQLEVSPYGSTSLTRAPGSSANPFYKPNDVMLSAGADIKYGLSSDFTLTATINPDFGQVEADPAIINLSAYETFFPEQRPFFQEGTDIFRFGNTKTFISYGTPTMFYSRRIGRQPQGLVGAAGINAEFTDRPDQTTIAGAAKLSGKTKNGFSVGLLNAFTTRENAEYVTFSNEHGTVSVEPPTNYMVARAKQDLKNGRTVVGGYASAVNRMIGTPYLANSIHESAYIGGFDFEHSWNDRDYLLSGVISGSSVSGSREALLRTQNSSARYFGRPDANYLSVDPDRTAMNGYFGELSFAKYGGEHVRGSVSYAVVSPGYEINDIGFQMRADQHVTTYFLQYRENSAAAPLRSYNLNARAIKAWNFGGDMTANSYGISGSMQFSNLWSLSLNTVLDGNRKNDRLLRGGPIAASLSGSVLSAVLSSNKSKKTSFDIGHLRQNNEAGEYTRSMFLSVTLRPAPNVQVSLGPSYNYGKDIDQYVRRVQDATADATYGSRYVFADIDQQTLSSNFRLDWTFSPNMSLQTYIRPYITTGNFYNYKEFTTPRELEFDLYGVDRGTISQNGGTYTVDPDGAGPAGPFSFGEQDFNFKSVQTNAVFRWEYNPGAFLYVVWQQDKSAFARESGLDIGRSLQGLVDTAPTNIFLIKMSYWFGS